MAMNHKFNISFVSRNHSDKLKHLYLRENITFKSDTEYARRQTPNNALTQNMPDDVTALVTCTRS